MQGSSGCVWIQPKPLFPMPYTCFTVATESGNPAPGPRNPLPQAVGVDRKGTSSTFMAGEALAYVQGFGPKASAVVLRRLSSSPVTRAILW